MRSRRLRNAALIVLGVLGLIACALPLTARAGDDPPNDPPKSSKEIREIRRSIEKLEADREADRVLIDQLRHRLDQVESENHQLKAASEQLQGQTSDQIKQIETKVETGPSPSAFSDAFGRYLGSRTFSVTGAAGFDFVFDQQSAALDGFPHETQNSFFADWEPMILYRPADWILFEGVLSASAGSGGTGTDLSTADFQLFLNDYMTVVGGLFDQPFGDWYENQSPMWVNRFVSAPLPFAVEPVVPPGEIGVQLRGGLQWGQLGQDFDYTTWIGNGPSFSDPSLGAAMSGPNFSSASQTHGRSYGGRLRLYPIPVDSNLGRLELGASTYDGKWLDGDWLTSWGVDYNYLMGNFETRGEWLESYRELPGGTMDNRQGWYVQLGYTLAELNLPFLSDDLNARIHRLEPLIRYSGVNQRQVDIGDIGPLNTFTAGLVPDFGLSGSPALFAPHSREVAIGLDYYIAPSIVWQNELDIELPRAGGSFFTPATGSTPATTTLAGSIPSDKAFLSQFTVGF